MAETRDSNGWSPQHCIRENIVSFQGTRREEPPLLSHALHILSKVLGCLPVPFTNLKASEMLACLCLLAYLCSLLFPTTPRPHSPSSQNCPVSQAEGDAISFTKSFRLGYWLLGGGRWWKISPSLHPHTSPPAVLGPSHIFLLCPVLGYMRLVMRHLNWKKYVRVHIICREFCGLWETVYFVVACFI